MFERFTDDARQAVVAAAREARRSLQWVTDGRQTGREPLLLLPQ